MRNRVIAAFVLVLLAVVLLVRPGVPLRQGGASGPAEAPAASARPGGEVPAAEGIAGEPEGSPPALASPAGSDTERTRRGAGDSPREEPRQKAPAAAGAPGDPPLAVVAAAELRQLQEQAEHHAMIVATLQARVSASEAPYVADLNGDGRLDLLDLLEFQRLLAAGDMRADFSGDGVLDHMDSVAFQSELAAQTRERQGLELEAAVVEALHSRIQLQLVEKLNAIEIELRPQIGPAQR